MQHASDAGDSAARFASSSFPRLSIFQLDSLAIPAPAQVRANRWAVYTHKGAILSLYFQEYGSNSAPTIVFLHGGGVSGWMWQPQIEQLSDYHCIVPDLPEQGDSVDGTPFTIQGSAEKIADLIRTRAHNGKAHVVGLSEGAQITLALLSLAPELIDHAIISSALVRPIPGGSLMTPKLIKKEKYSRL